MGWHHQNCDFSKYTQLWALRKSLEGSCNIMHKYNNDSDFFVAIGDLTNLDTITDVELAELKEAGKQIEQVVRDELATDPKLKLDLQVHADSTYVAQYEKETLALDSTRVFSVTSANVDKNFISRLYDC